jgi:hypothetical protein
VDGIDGNIIYEFLGDYFHGNPSVFVNKNEINVKTKKCEYENCKKTY